MTLTEQIRPLFLARDPLAMEGATDIAASYQEQYRAINNRISRCSDYLRRGLRSEAVHLAECHPNVLREAEDLQAPDAADMERFFLALGLVPPQTPEDAVLEDLRNACETEQSLAVLMSQHRTLAVGRGPIRQRLSVLYALAKMDPKNQNWPTDIRQMETERFREMEREYKTAIRESDLTELQKLGREVSQTTWLKLPPKDLVLRVQKSVASIRREARITALRELITSVQTARAAGEQVKCARLLDEWQALTTSADVRELELPADLLTNGADIMQATGAWLTGERRRQLQEQKKSEPQPAGRSILARAIRVLFSPLRFLVRSRD